MKKHINELIKFKRNGYDEPIDGFILDYNDDFTLINFVNRDMYINGYTIFSNNSVSSYRVQNDYKKFIKRALKVQGIKPKSLKNIDIANWVSAIQTANQIFPLITIHRELIDNTVCYIGSVDKFTDKTVTFKLIPESCTKYSSGVRRDRFFYAPPGIPKLPPAG